DCSELMNYCSWSQTTQNGVEGFLIMGQNGNSIFLPFTGYRSNEDLIDSNSAYYWTSSRSNQSSEYAYYYSSNSGYRNISRSFGCVVRPVFMPNATSISISPASMELLEGDQGAPSYGVQPSGADQTVTWTSTNPSVATVSELGLITGISQGKATIIAVTKDGGFVATCEVEVKRGIKTVGIYEFINAGEGTRQYRITGIINEFTGTEHGKFYLKDGTGEIYVDGLGNESDLEKLGLKEGDIITVVGERGSNNGVPQMNNGQYESHKPVTDISIGDFNNLPDGQDTYYMVTGEITRILNTKYGNYYIKDEAGDELYIYGCQPGWYVEGRYITDFIADDNFEVGDRVVLIGTKSSYASVVEMIDAVCFRHIKPTEPGKPEAVDLGLSVKWANCNVGADSPEGYGDYFAWGETKPKDDYSWDTYFDRNSEGGFMRYDVSKSNLVLFPEDDAAYVNWGSDWRMPTLEEQKELIENCKWELTTQNGVKGYKVTSKTNNNYIFLPQAGMRVNNWETSYPGSRGCYWSSTFDTGSSSNAYYMITQNTGKSWGYEQRRVGYSVRPVFNGSSN
ncbi:MAG: Ig-like domain-containing protein, partial [Prevotellaceae bacterium]|nr:Ig-like domain-containing protein [Prevotellaceae bacterium]